MGQVIGRSAVLLGGSWLARRRDIQALARSNGAATGVNFVGKRPIMRRGFLKVLPADIADIVHRRAITIVGILPETFCEICRRKKRHDALHLLLVTIN